MRCTIYQTLSKDSITTTIFSLFYKLIQISSKKNIVIQVTFIKYTEYIGEFLVLQTMGL